MLTFIMLYFSEREENALQTLRFLHRREPDLRESQIVLVCTGSSKPIASPFPDTKYVDMNLDRYHRNAMFNEGVRHAKHDLLAFLDSDRILPPGYFTRICSQIHFGDIITTRRLYSLPRPYTDEQIESLEIDRLADFRSIDNRMRKKNLFSGNTVMSRIDLEEVGGFDERFVGYGFSDTDMTTSTKKHGMNHVFLEEEELHLYHPIGMMWNGKHVPRETIKLASTINGMRYCLKWGINPDPHFMDLLNEIDKMPKQETDLELEYMEKRKKVANRCNLML